MSVLAPFDHRYGEPPKREGAPPLSPDVLRVYIAQAKTYEPHVPPELTGEGSCVRGGIAV